MLGKDLGGSLIHMSSTCCGFRTHKNNGHTSRTYYRYSRLCAHLQDDGRPAQNRLERESKVTAPEQFDATVELLDVRKGFRQVLLHNATRFVVPFFAPEV